MKNSIVGERIRTRRKELRLNQTQLAEITGYRDKTAISRIESGENDLTQSKIMLFANALQTSPSYIMGWVDDPSPKSAPTPKGKIIPHQEHSSELQQAYDNADERTQKAVRVLLGIDK